jgi:glycosyltransferase involved in cell wall biosynthesis
MYFNKYSLIKENRLKVLHIITRLTLGGAQETVLYYYDKIDRKKFDVFFMSGIETEFGQKDIIHKLSQDSKFAFAKYLSNNINPINDIKAIWEIFCFIKKNKIQIVHTHSAKAGFVGRTAAFIAGVPVILHTVHGWSFNPLMKPLIKSIYIFLEKIMARISKKLITVTSTDIDKGVGAGIGNFDKYIVIRSGIDFSKFDNTQINLIEDCRRDFFNRKIIGAVGRISPPKNYKDFVRIAKELCRRRDDLYFVIVGEGELRAELEEFIKEQEMTDKILLMGLRLDVNVLLRVFDVLLLTSLWEGLPRVLPEAMYCGVPIVSNAIDGVKEIISDEINGILIKPLDINGACDSIEKLLKDEDLRNRIIENGKESSLEYSAQKMLHETQNLYMELYKKTRGEANGN